MTIKNNIDEIYFDETDGGLHITKKSIMMLICTQSGGGKSLSMEGIAESYYKSNKAIIISPFDPKKNFETAFLMFPATEPYHVRELKIQGREAKGLPVKIWHPFTFDIPKNKLPEMNFFTMPFSKIDRDMLNYLFETSVDTNEIQQILKTIRELKSSEGFFETIHKINEIMKDDEERLGMKKIVKPRPPFYTTRVMSGTLANLTEIQSMMIPFVNDYFLAPDDSPINLDIEEILKDQEHIHVFSCKWIKDDKQALFAVMFIMKLIIDAFEKARNQIVFTIEELPQIFPLKPKGFKEYLSKFTSEQLKKMRSKSMMIIGTTQDFNIDEQVLDAFPKKFLGKILNFSDTFALSKELKISKDAIDSLKEVKKGRFFDLNELAVDDSARPYVMKFSTGSHAEEGMKFLATYEKWHEKMPDQYPMKSYGDLIKQMKEFRDNEMKSVERKANKSYAEKEKRIEAYNRKKEEAEKGKQRTQQQKEELKQKEEQIRMSLMKQVYEKKNDAQRLGQWGKGKDMDWSKLSLAVFGKKDHKKAQRFYDEFAANHVVQQPSDETVDNP